MKKILTITISGIIFNLEDDAFEKLNAYLNDLHKYFASYKDSFEIIQDIESRIAEIFLSKQSTEKQYINLADVESLVAVMGNISDFEAEEAENADLVDETHASKAQNPKSEKSQFRNPNGRLLRDTKRKLLGGVASGLANYFGADPLWVRLAFVVFTTGLFIFPPISGFTVLLYLALWVSMPGTNSIPESEGFKKFFRNPDKKVLGGVAGGIASYTGFDVAVIRFLFVISFGLFGTGLVFYLLLWLITPLASTLTDRMQMEGEPITIQNIEQKVKSNLNESPGAPESVLAKIMLFPFRVISLILSGIKPIANFAMDAIRVLSGLLMVFVGLVITLSILLVAFMLWGIIPFNDSVVVADIPVRMLGATFSNELITGGFISLLIPTLALGGAGIALLIKRNFVKPYILWSFAGIWFIGLLLLSLSLPQYVSSFKAQGQYTTTTLLSSVGSGPLQINLKPSDYDTADGFYQEVNLTIKPSLDDSVWLEQLYFANGRTRKEGEINARSVRYGFLAENGKITFNSHFTLEKNAVFKHQGLDLVLYIPKNREFVINSRVGDILSNTLSPAGYDEDDLETGRWVFGPKGLECLTCSHRPFNENDEDEGNIAPEAPEAPQPSAPPTLPGKSESQNRLPKSDFGKINIKVGRLTISQNQNSDNTDSESFRHFAKPNYKGHIVPVSGANNAIMLYLNPAIA